MSRPPIALGLAALLSLSGCGREEEAATTAAVAEPVVTVGRENVAIAATAELRSGPLVSGALRAEREATLRAQIGGAVEQAGVEAGERVRRGQVLARIDDAAVRDAYLSARSAVRTAEAALANARRDAERAERLAQAGALPERDLENARWAATNAEAALADARARLASAEEQLAHTVVRAPFAGVVSDRPVDAGDIVQVGAALVTLVDPSRMRLEAAVPAEQVGRVRAGVPVEFAVAGHDRRFTGRIDRVNPVVDPATGQVRIYVEIPNAERALVAGLYAEGRVATEVRRAVAVPTTAVDSRGLAPVVRRLRGGRVAEVPVRLGVRDELQELVEVRSGLAEGDTVLLGSAQGVTAGARIRVLAEEAGR